MKRSILLLFYYLIYFSADSQNWQLVWEDNFDGNSIDTTKWSHDYGTGSQYGMWGWGNGELQYYQSQNTLVNNGIAKIQVKEEPNGIMDSWGALSYYSSSKITTKGLFDFRFGKIEARMKSIEGEGFWPAFWMLPTGGNWPCDGEIDIMEQWGNNYLTNATTGAAHIGTCPYSQSSHFYQNFSSYISTGSYADDFHKYSVIWKEDTITWYVDDVEQFKITPSDFWSIPSQHTWPFNSNDWYLMINLAIKQSGPNANTIFPNQIEIDYVKVYQQDFTNSIDKHNNPMSLYINSFNNLILPVDIDLQSIKIFNIEGKLLIDEHLNNKNKLDLNFLNSGIYIVELNDQTGIKINDKIVINKY